MSLYIPTTDEKIIEYQNCIRHFTTVRSKFYSRLEKPQAAGKRSRLRASINYFDDRLIYYRKQIKDLEKWRD